MSYPLLERINAPGEIKICPQTRCPPCARKFRQFLIKSVSEQAAICPPIWVLWN